MAREGGEENAYWPSRLSEEISHLDSRRQDVKARVEFELDAVRRAQDR